MLKRIPVLVSLSTAVLALAALILSLNMSAVAHHAF